MHVARFQWVFVLKDKILDLLLMEEMLHQLRLIVYPIIYWQGLIHVRWCRISAINNITCRCRKRLRHFVLWGMPVAAASGAEPWDIEILVSSTPNPTRFQSSFATSCDSVQEKKHHPNRKLKTMFHLSNRIQFEKLKVTSKGGNIPFRTTTTTTNNNNNNNRNTNNQQQTPKNKTNNNQPQKNITQLTTMGCYVHWKFPVIAAWNFRGWADLLEKWWSMFARLSFRGKNHGFFTPKLGVSWWKISTRIIFFQMGWWKNTSDWDWCFLCGWFLFFFCREE